MKPPNNFPFYKGDILEYYIASFWLRNIDYFITLWLTILRLVRLLEFVWVVAEQAFAGVVKATGVELRLFVIRVGIALGLKWDKFGALCSGLSEFLFYYSRNRMLYDKLSTKGYF